MRTKAQIKEALNGLKEIQSIDGEVIDKHIRGGMAMLEWILGKDWEPEPVEE